MRNATSVHQVVVDAAPGGAHRCFAEHMGEWWPAEHTVSRSETKLTVRVDPRLGGLVREVGVEGTELVIGTITEWNPPVGLAISWQITSDWQSEPDISKASEYRVGFTADGSRTVVTVHHDGFERHGPGGAGVRAAVDSPGGWPLVLDAFRRHVGVC